MKVFSQATLLFLGVALTWTCAAFGLFVATIHRCPSPRISYAKRRVEAVEQAVIAYRADHGGGCPKTKDELIDDGYVDKRNFRDPWGKTIQFRCDGEHVRVGSAGPDNIGGTADDVHSW
jgi:hypothetical protein